MQEKFTFLAIIPARGGSKGLPGKNIIDLCGKPLMVWSIEAALGSQYITQTVVSSDCDIILKGARDSGARPLRRPDVLANDSAPSEPVISHVIESLALEDQFFDYIVLLQPTSPLRSAEDIDFAIREILAKNADALISVYEPEHTPYKAFITNKQGYLAGLVDNKTPFMRRQDLPVTYMPNGAIYIVKTDLFKQSGRLFSDKTIPYLMSIEKSSDIDTYEDLERVREIMVHSGQCV